MAVYEIVIDDEVVWSSETRTYEGLKSFPADLRGRPVSGQVRLLVDGVTIATMQTLADDELDKVAAAFDALHASEKGI